MPDPLLYLQAISAAAAIGATLVLVVALTHRSPTRSFLNSVCVLAIGFGMAAGIRTLTLRLAWPPLNALDRLLLIVLPATLLVEWIAGMQRVSSRIGWSLRMILVALIPWVLLHDSVYLSGDGDWPAMHAAAAICVCCVFLASCWSLLSLLSRRGPGISIPLALCLALQCAGTTVMMAGYISGGAAALPLVATMVASTIAVSLTSRYRNDRSDPVPPVLIGIGIVGLFGVLFVGHFFGRLSAGRAVAMLLAPLLCWGTELAAFRHRNAWVAGSIRLSLVSLPLVVVLVLAKRDFDRDMSPLVRSESLRFPTLIESDRSFRPGLQTARARH